MNPFNDWNIAYVLWISTTIAATLVGIGWYKMLQRADAIEKMHKLAQAANASTGIVVQKTDKTGPTK